MTVFVRLKDATDLNVNYALQQLIFTRDSTTNAVTNTTVFGPLGASFSVVIPANERTASIIVQGLRRPSVSDERVTLKLVLPQDGSYVTRIGQAKATVTVLANNL